MAYGETWKNLENVLKEKWSKRPVGTDAAPHSAVYQENYIHQ